jgi:hypothetical protein
LAYLEAKRGKEAATEFQKIVDRRGISPLTLEWALALVGLARAHAAVGNIPASRDSYRRVLLLWNNADPDLEIARRVRLESQAIERRVMSNAVIEKN